MVFNQSEVLFLKLTFTNTFKEVKNEFKATLCLLKRTQFNHEFILCFLEQLFVSLSFKNENSPFVNKNHDVPLSQ